MPQVNLGACACCGGNTDRTICPHVCTATATVDGLTVTFSNPFVQEPLAGGGFRQLALGYAAGTTFINRPAGGTGGPTSQCGLPPLTELRPRYCRDQDGALPCVTPGVIAGEGNVQRLAEDGRAAIVLSPDKAFLNEQASPVGVEGSASGWTGSAVFYRELNAATFRPNWSATWGYGWAADSGVLKFLRTIGGLLEDGTPVTTANAKQLELALGLVMPLACNDDGTCDELAIGEVISGATSWSCGCCALSSDQPGCRPCDNPLP